MAIRATLMLVPIAKQDDINAVWAARGLGSGNFYKTASPAGGGASTHTYSHDASMTVERSAETAGLTDNSGTLPDISGNASPGDTWLHWFPSAANEAAAQARGRAACAAMLVDVGANWPTPEDHLNGMLSGISLVADEIQI